MAVVVFLLFHWQLSVLMQSLFLHRYGAHRQFEMSRFWERALHLITFLAQGSSYLSPRAYAILHRMHHAYSDTERDPHSPANHRSVVGMMMATLRQYRALLERRQEPEARFDGGYPEWPLLEKLGRSWWSSLVWVALYSLFYWRFASSAWLFALLPLHFLMGPVHGAIVNYCGHRFGYRNFGTSDLSRNTLVVDFVAAGELFQNNHHRFAMSPNFAARWFEIDPTYWVLRVLAVLGVVRLTSTQRMRYPEANEFSPREVLQALAAPPIDEAEQG